MKFTGERFVPTEKGEIRVEHFHRYALARGFSQGGVVLDLACGEGYGSAMLCQTAQHVVGVDVSPEAVGHAELTYGHLKNLRFECRSAIDTGFSDAFFDVVVSYETIEHLAEQSEMLAEIRRVLKADGILIMSSPNRPVYSEGRDYHNEFHVKELNFAEFDDLLCPHFGQIDYYGQRLAMGTVIQPLDQNLPEYKAFSDDGIYVSQRTFSMQLPVYYLAVCGPAGKPLPNLNASIFIPDSLDLVQHYVGFAQWAQKQDREIEIRDKNVQHYKKNTESLDLVVGSLKQEIVELRAEIKTVGRQREQLHLEIIRAEAQLALLKDLMLDDKSLESF